MHMALDGHLEVSMLPDHPKMRHIEEQSFCESKNLSTGA